MNCISVKEALVEVKHLGCREKAQEGTSEESLMCTVVIKTLLAAVTVKAFMLALMFANKGFSVKSAV